MSTTPAGVGSEDPSGNIDVKFRLSDSAEDRVDVEVEFDIVGDTPDSGFKLARPAATASDQPTPAFAFADLRPTIDASWTR